MNIEGCSVTGNSNSYAPLPVSATGDFQSHMDSAFIQVDTQRKYETDIEENEEETENFLQEYVKKEEEEEEKKDEKLIDYLLEALRGREKELRMEGNSYMDDGVRMEYLQNNFPGLFGSQEPDVQPSGVQLSEAGLTTL